MTRGKGIKNRHAPPVEVREKPRQKDLETAAYYRWLERGAPVGGDGQEDWFEVENRWRDNIVPENND